MFSLPASTISTRKRVLYLSCQPSTAGQLHLVVIKETFARVIASRGKATTMHRNQYLSENVFGFGYEDISSLMSHLYSSCGGETQEPSPRSELIIGNMEV
ncbi:hypothetical protein AVEN_167091-1 [Araneus ventricosus]|uniref:Uncharacterized protein n=1 Tax=Araneus ventricosus TaxID=182803 RepID=A0A4Y2WA13_ARAVE|nr:hypothetical protein AVEN_167091-1 [Araneus ventricosus]